MYRLAVVVAVIAGILIPAAQANASSVPQTQKGAERLAVNAAKKRYKPQYVAIAIAVCKKEKRTWKCVWAGADKDGYSVYGRIRLSSKGAKVITPMRSGSPDHV